jgi:hypothetical protein
VTVSEDDIVEQITISMVLLESKTISGKRLSMIVVDNAVEFMLKCYGNTVLLGQGVVKREAWEKTKNSFKTLLDTVFDKAKLSPNPQDILEYHNTRNALYHDALPLTVETDKLKEYIKQSQVLLKELFGRGFTDTQWKHRVSETRVRLASKEKTTLIEYEKIDDSHVKIVSEKPLSKDIDAIALTVYGYAKELGRKPTVEELEASLSFSGHPISPASRLTNNIKQLRVRNVLNRKELSLTRNAAEILKKKFFIPHE